MHSNPTPPPFETSAGTAVNVEAAVERANAGWTAEQTEADAVAAGFTPEQAAAIIDEAWTVIL